MQCCLCLASTLSFKVRALTAITVLLHNPKINLNQISFCKKLAKVIVYYKSK